MHTKKKILIAAISILVIAIITVGTMFILKSNTATDVKKTPTVTQQSADKLQDQATTALKNAQTDKAKKLLEEAKAQYIKLEDTNNVIDVEAQLYLIDHPTK